MSLIAVCDFCKKERPPNVKWLALDLDNLDEISPEYGLYDAVEDEIDVCPTCFRKYFPHRVREKEDVSSD